MRLIVVLSYFHRKNGPMVFYSYPENLLRNKVSSVLPNIMDQANRDEFFTYSFDGTKCMNYYFVIRSEWARGNKDALMISIVFEQQTTTDLEPYVSTVIKEFSERLKSTKNVYSAFYYDDLRDFNLSEIKLIGNKYFLVKLWIKNLYYSLVEEFGDKTEEQKVAALLNKKHIFFTIKKLSKGPINLEQLEIWFKKKFSDKDFKEMIKNLLEKHLIFINQKGRFDKYVLLLKEVNVERVPPANIMEYIDKMPELTDLLMQKVQEYFNRYENKVDYELDDDAFLLYQILSDPKKYHFLSKLRSNFIHRDKLLDIVPKITSDNLYEIIKFLKKYDVIEELTYNKKRYIALKTDLQITTAFPAYLKKLVHTDIKIGTSKLNKELEVF